VGIMVDHPLAGIPAGITKLSELIIDDDKDWQGFGITNLKELVAGMGTGGLLVHNGSVLVNTLPGTIGHEFTSTGEASKPTWQPPPGL